jgi:hypothetical protein
MIEARPWKNVLTYFGTAITCIFALARKPLADRHDANQRHGIINYQPQAEISMIPCPYSRVYATENCYKPLD